MDLWILSQKKDQLVKTNVVRYSYFKDKLTNDELHIITNNDYDFGFYKTKERALEVLAEMQKLLIGDLLVFKNIEFEKGLADYVKPYKAIAIYGDRQDKDNLAPKVEFIHRDCVVFEMPNE